jgi:hypothetical protein
MMAQSGGSIALARAPFEITGGATTHMFADMGAIGGNVAVYTVRNNPLFTVFAEARRHGTIYVEGCTYTGGARGIRYKATLLSAISTGTTNQNFFPGATAGTVASGGIYA